ncbi:MAG: diadenylate cyclase CdaA [Desulfarculaceae bacterium]|nr:diadenylate cyclase CdaA [Desulfarculaceae bacterium]MCF8070987.1 diadenylate cyclase CdaA [Desulfarculaceae bacterium]MCF8100575.1 diadenylate cyclase CdaA [Desulfarculaceae bacterium]MCF8117707.1 diadenylate cyclase CdaA [Desulfarculaceae bacterium]
MLTDLLAPFFQLRWLDLVDIGVVAFVIYKVILLVKGTRAMQMLAGLGVVLLTMVLARQLHLVTIHWIIQSFLASLILVIIILFQSDIRKALARMGRGPMLAGSHEAQAATLEEVARSAVTLASRMTGALIVLERRIGLADYVDTGVRLDALVTRELMTTVFHVNTPLHDGAVIISGERLVAARCVLPLSTSSDGSRQVGTRHLAAMGLTEETDAVAVVVSEERGRVSLAVGGKLTQDLDAVALRKKLNELFQVGPKDARRFWRRERKSA